MTQSDSPDLIVLDVCLAEGTAFDVVNALRQDDRLREVAIMVYSARDLTPEEKQELDLGHTEFYTKSRIAPEVFARRAVDRIRKISSIRKAAVAH